MFSLFLIRFVIAVCFWYWSHGGISRQRLCFPFGSTRNFPVPLPIFFRLPKGLQSAPWRQSTNPGERRRQANPCRTSAKIENSNRFTFCRRMLGEGWRRCGFWSRAAISSSMTNVEANSGGLSFRLSSQQYALKEQNKRKTVFTSYNCSMFWLFKCKWYMLVMLCSLVHAFNLIWHLTLNSLTCTQSSPNQVSIKSSCKCVLFCTDGLQSVFHWCAVSSFDLQPGSESVSY